MKTIIALFISLLFCIPASGKLIVGIEGIYYKPSQRIPLMISENGLEVLKGMGIELGWKFKLFETGINVNLVKGSKTNPSLFGGVVTDGIDLYQFTPRAAFTPPLKESPIYPYLGLGFPYYIMIENFKTPYGNHSDQYPNLPFGIEPFIGINYSPIKQLGFRFEGRDQLTKPAGTAIIQGLRLTAGIIFQY